LEFLNASKERITQRGGKLDGESEEADSDEEEDQY